MNVTPVGMGPVPAGCKPGSPGKPNVRQMNTKDFQSLPAPVPGAPDGCVYQLANSVMTTAGSHRGILTPYVS